MLRTIIPGFVLMALAASLCAAQTVINTKHDLSSTSVGVTNHSTNESQVCIFCHTPHQKGITSSPLWNRGLSSNATYGVYSSPSLKATPTEIGAGGATISNLCMSCHDGTVGVDSLGNKSSIGTPTFTTGTELDANRRIAAGRIDNLGTNLTIDHPVNFTYDAALVALTGDLKTPTSTQYVDVAKKVPLYNAKLQCSSCHDPHTNQNGQFLRMSNAGSALCLACHVK